MDSIVSKTLEGFVEPNSIDFTSKFISLLKSKWNDMHQKPNVFRYKIDNVKERIVDDKYLLQLNPDRALNRRTPEFISNMSQPFSKEKFNFTKVSQDEVLFSIGSGVDDPELHSFLVNVSPISQYHTLFCPFINKKIPQTITEESLWVTTRVMFIANDSHLKIGFNSLCGMASVNHLHFHLFMESHNLPIEKAKWEPLLGNLCYLVDYPSPAFCFKIDANSSKDQIAEVYRLIEYLQDNSIAHNIFMKVRDTLDIVEVYVFPRKSTSGVKQLSAFNVAVLELSGWFPVFNEEAFLNLKSEELENEMKKWKYDDFKELCRKVCGILYGKESKG